MWIGIEILVDRSAMFIDTKKKSGINITTPLPNGPPKNEQIQYGSPGFLGGVDYGSSSFRTYQDIATHVERQQVFRPSW